ncbi:MAG TPA: group III truncated hemoglobin [Bradyrhizobium sp.]|jgi:hemoglobin
MISGAAKLDHVSEDSIRRLVDGFYAKVRRDPELAPIFLRAIPGDWGPHLAKMYAFWSSVMLTTGRYKGNPVVKHLAIPGIQPALFKRWLALFNETSAELFDDAVSAEFQAKAARIAESLQLALFYRPDRPWPPEPVK